MRFNSFYGTLFAICLTALIFATLVGGLCIIRHIETRRARREETATHMPPPAPSPYGIDLPTLNTPDDFRASDETLVEPVRPLPAPYLGYPLHRVERQHST